MTPNIDFFRRYHIWHAKLPHLASYITTYGTFAICGTNGNHYHVWYTATHGNDCHCYHIWQAYHMWYQSSYVVTLPCSGWLPYLTIFIITIYGRIPHMELEMPHMVTIPYMESGPSKYNSVRKLTF